MVPWILARLALLMWVLFYLCLQGMACAFVTGETLGGCRIRLRWQVRATICGRGS